jgi:hypothetical protein
LIDNDTLRSSLAQLTRLRAEAITSCFDDVPLDWITETDRRDACDWTIRRAGILAANGYLSADAVEVRG